MRNSNRNRKTSGVHIPGRETLGGKPLDVETIVRFRVPRYHSTTNILRETFIKETAGFYIRATWSYVKKESADYVYFSTHEEARLYSLRQAQHELRNAQVAVRDIEALRGVMVTE